MASNGFLALVRLTFYRTLGSDPSWAMKLTALERWCLRVQQASPDEHQRAHASSIRRTCRDYKRKKA